MHEQDLDWIAQTYRHACRRNDAARKAELLARAVRLARDTLRFTQCGREHDLHDLAQRIRSDRPVALREPFAASLDWSPSAARLWACDCAERVVDLYAERMDDQRATDAIAVARRFARGDASEVDLANAHARARDAATHLVRLETVSPAWSAAMAAVRCSAASGAWDGGRDAARLAARNARWAREGDDTEVTPELRWQAERLLERLIGP